MTKMLICPDIINCPAYKDWNAETKKIMPTIIKEDETGYGCSALIYIQQNRLGASEVDCANLELLNNQSKLLKLLEIKN